MTTAPDHITSTAPKRIYLDIGDQFALERVTSGSLRWDLLEGVTWSEDNATSHGIPYVRADLATPPAASGAAPALPTPWKTVTDATGEPVQVWRAFQMRDYARAALASREAAQPASPALLTDEQIDYESARINRTDDSWESLPHRRLARWAFEKGSAAALASPQVAPAPEQGKRAAAAYIQHTESPEDGPHQELVWEKDRNEELHGTLYDYTPLYKIESLKLDQCDTEGIVRALRGKSVTISLAPYEDLDKAIAWVMGVGIGKALAAPVQVAPAISDARLLEIGEMREMLGNIAARVLSEPRPLEFCRKIDAELAALIAPAATPIQAPAAADDARDAARYRFLRESDGLDEQVAGLNQSRWNEVIDAAMSASTPAAKPAEPTQGDAK